MLRYFWIVLSVFFSCKTFCYTGKPTDNLALTFKNMHDSIMQWQREGFRMQDGNFISGNDSELKLFKEGIIAYQNNDYKQALAYYTLLLQNPNLDFMLDGFVHWQLGRITQDSMQYGCSARHYNWADSIFNICLTPSELIRFYKALAFEQNSKTSTMLPWELMNKGLQLALEKNEWLLAATFMNKQISYYRFKGKYYQALKAFNHTLSFCREHKLGNYEGYVLTWAYEMYQYTGDTARLLRDLNRSLFVCSQYDDSTMLAKTCNEFGRYYAQYGDFKNANRYYERAAILNSMTNNNYELSINYLNLGENYLDQMNFDQSESYFNKAIALNNRVAFSIGNGFCYAGLVELYHKQGNNEKALHYAKLAKKYAREANYHRVDKYLYERLIPLYILLEEKDSCIAYLLKQKILIDSIDSKEIHAKMQMYESQIKENEIKLLQNQKRQFLMEKSKTRQKVLGLVIILVIIALAMIFIMILFFNKEKANALLVEKNMQLIQMGEERQKCADHAEMQLVHTEQDVELAQRFMTLLKHDANYRNPNISMDYFADKLHTNRAYLSKAINKTTRKNFTMVINEYRIQEACKMLVSSKYNYLSIEGIACTVGFNSKTSFNRVFKMQTGLTPSNFRSNQHEA
jgi:AraC-like DNA-binding protein